MQWACCFSQFYRDRAADNRLDPLDNVLPQTQLSDNADTSSAIIPDPMFESMVQEPSPSFSGILARYWHFAWTSDPTRLLPRGLHHLPLPCQLSLWVTPMYKAAYRKQHVNPPLPVVI